MTHVVWNAARRARLAAATAAGLLAACAPAAPAQPPTAAPPDLRDGLPVAAPPSAGLAPAPLAALARDVAAGRFRRITSVLVVKDGRLVYERYFAGGGRDTLNDTRSAMKSVTALAVGAAIADGHLRDVAQPAFPLLAGDPAVRAAAADARLDPRAAALRAAVTLEDLLTMSSALDCDDDVSESPGNEERMYPEPRWLAWALRIPVRRDYARDAGGRGPFHYCTAGSFLLGQVVQRAAGEPADRYVERRLLRPLGITAARWPRSPAGEVMTGGGLGLRSRDLAKLGQLVLDEGRWHGRELLPAAWVRRALTEHRRPTAEQGYGYQFWRRTYRTAAGDSAAAWYMSGNGGNHVAVLPAHRAVVVVTSTNYNTRGMHQQSIALVERYVLPALTGRAGP